MSTTNTGRAKRWGGRAGAIGLAVAAATMMTALPVSAEVEREKHGSCSGSSRWELSLEKEHGQIEVDLDIDTIRSGRAWRVRMSHDGTAFLTTRRVTDRHGEIDVDRHRNDRAGRDRISFRAVDLVNGEVCRGSLGI